MQAEQNQYLPYLEDGEEILLKGKLTGKEQKNEQYLYNLSSCDYLTGCHFYRALAEAFWAQTEE